MCRPEPHRTLVEQLRTLRQETGLTYAELADPAQGTGIVLSASRLSKFLNGHELPQPQADHCPAPRARRRRGHAPAPDALRATQQLLYAVLDATG